MDPNNIPVQRPKTYPAPAPQPPEKPKRNTALLACLFALLAILIIGLFVFLFRPQQEQRQYEVTLASSSPSSGTVEGGGVYDRGDVIEIRAVAKEGFVFYRWNDGSTEAVREIKVRDDVKYTASFRPASPEDAIDGPVMYEALQDRIVTDVSSAPEGYVLAEDASVETTYVRQWPAGFSTDHPLYSQYSQISAGASDERIVGYLYWHWCRGELIDGPINRTTGLVRDGRHNCFHAYYSTVRPDISGDYIFDDRWIVNPTPDGTYHHPDACCTDTYWFYVVPVMEGTFHSRDSGVYIYESWSEPSEEKPSIGEYRTVRAQ